MSIQKCDVVVIGGGLIGLATALQLQKFHPHLDICLLEKEACLATHQSGRNSGVAHAGIYYEPGSLKARLCVDGKNALREYCEINAIPYQACGKVIVASNKQEVERLDFLYARGCENQVPGLRLITDSELRDIEPRVVGLKAIYSPESAIVDFGQVAESFASDFKASGGRIFLHTTFQSVSEVAARRRIVTSDKEFDAGLIINCAGLYADVVAKQMGCDPQLRIVPFRGDFFDLVPGSTHMVRGLVYPVPDPALPFLGVHLTPTVSGTVRAGPNAILATKREGYLGSDFSARDVADTMLYPGFWRFTGRYIRPGITEINRSLRKRVFVRSVQKLVPDVRAEDLVRSRSGVRAQAIDPQGRLVDDFRIAETPGAIHVLNAPSPAATSSIKIGEFVASKAAIRINAS